MVSKPRQGDSEGSVLELDSLRPTKRHQETRWLGVGAKSPLARCLPETKLESEGGKTLLFLSKPKNINRQAAQKARSRLRCRLRWPLSFNNKSGVTGAFWQTWSPASRLKPLRRDVNCQLSTSGLGRPTSRLMMRRTLRYCQTDLYERRHERWATYLLSSAVVTGKGGQRRTSQKLRYIFR